MVGAVINGDEHAGSTPAAAARLASSPTWRARPARWMAAGRRRVLLAPQLPTGDCRDVRPSG